MKNCLRMITICAIMLSANFASAASAPSFSSPSSKKLSAAQCTKLRSDLDKYISAVEAWVNTQPAKLRPLLSKLADFAINEAIKISDKLCPAPVVDNHYSPDSPYECPVVDSTGSQIVSVGLTSTLALSNNSANISKTACMSFTACIAIVPQKLATLDPLLSPLCSNPSEASVYHLTDSEVQTKITEFQP